MTGWWFIRWIALSTFWTIGGRTEVISIFHLNGHCSGFYPQTRNSNRSTGTDTLLAGYISRWHLRISCARFLNEFLFFRRWNCRESRDHQQTFSSGTTGFLNTFVSNLWFRTRSKGQCYAIFYSCNKLKRVSLSTEFFKVMVQLLVV